MWKKNLKYLKEPYRILLRLDERRIITLPDKLYLEYRSRAQLGIEMNIDNPKTFNEKLQWLKLHDRNSLYIKMVDKYEVREYIKKSIGEEYLIPLIGVYDDFSEIDFDKLPNKFVIKCTHDSGSVIVCKDKKKLDISASQIKINKSLKKNYFYGGREWPYKSLIPKIIIEEYMEDDKNHELVDYKFMCFNGSPEIIFTCTERFTKDGLKVTFFDKKWKRLPFKRHYEPSKKEIQKPLNFDKMMEFSKKLAKDIPFVRVDWYEVNNKLYFGELTFYPGSGYEDFDPQEWDQKLGDMLILPNDRKNGDYFEK